MSYTKEEIECLEQSAREREELILENQQLKQKIEKLTKCVEYYADYGIWRPEYETDRNYPSDYSCVESGDVDSDQIGGKLARKTLAEIKEEES